MCVRVCVCAIVSASTYDDKYKRKIRSPIIPILRPQKIVSFSIGWCAIIFDACTQVEITINVLKHLFSLSFSLDFRAFSWPFVSEPSINYIVLINYRVSPISTELTTVIMRKCYWKLHGRIHSDVDRYDDEKMSGTGRCLRISIKMVNQRTNCSEINWCPTAETVKLIVRCHLCPKKTYKQCLPRGSKPFVKVAEIQM